MNDLDALFSLPTGVLVALGVLVVLELVLLIVGVVAWANTPEDRMPPPSRWLWLALIVLLQILGPIAFLVARRQHARYAVPGPGSPPVVGSTGAADTIRRSSDSTADLLYGRREGDQ